LITNACDKAYQLLAHGRWFSPASSTTKTGRHDIAEILIAEGGVKHQSPREPQGLAAGFLLSIVLTLLSIIIDNEKAGSKYTHNLDNILN
jgi:heme/copper-type cytochrome/quinol oxidase subunit 4